MTSAALAAPRPSLAALERVSIWLAPLLLFGVALGVRVWAAGQITFPVSEGSAFYVGVARNLVEGRGLVSDAIWSYATPPLILPKPAFELWMPMGSLIAAPAMALLGTSFAAAQVSSVLMGALVAPLTWLVGREAATRAGLGPQRSALVASGSGLVAALLAPFVIAAVVPDSSTPFLVFSLGAVLLIVRYLEHRSAVSGFLVGTMLGLAYLSRQEALYLGIALLPLIGAAIRRERGSTRVPAGLRLLAPIVAGGLAVVTPWLARNLAAYGSLFPGQALENAYLSTNEQIFAYADRPTLASFLGQGPATILAHQAEALWHNLLTVLILPALPVGALGIAAVLVLRNRPAVAQATALRLLLASGLLTYLVTSLLFPVATRWGTFGHGAGPLLVGLTVAAMLGLDGAVRWAGRRRSWSRPNAWLAPLAAVTVALVFCLLQVTALSGQARDQQARISTAVAALRESGALGEPTAAAAGIAALISDHPIWMAEALRQPVIALPDETPAQVAQLGLDFGMPPVLVIDTRGRYPGAWLEPEGPGQECLAAPPEAVPLATGTAWLVRLRHGCDTP